MAGSTKRIAPGVYKDESLSEKPTIVGVPTAIPAFIGYTQKASVRAEAQPARTPPNHLSALERDLEFNP